MYKIYHGEYVVIYYILLLETFKKQKPDKYYFRKKILLTIRKLYYLKKYFFSFGMCYVYQTIQLQLVLQYVFTYIELITPKTFLFKLKIYNIRIIYYTLCQIFLSIYSQRAIVYFSVFYSNYIFQKHLYIFLYNLQTTISSMQKILIDIIFVKNVNLRRQHI